MNDSSPKPEDDRLSRLLREARPSPALPTRFQEAVWKRIADREGVASDGPAWLAAIAAWCLRPRFAVALAVAMVVAGTLLGTLDGAVLARQNAQARYLASVAPGAIE
jgi:hypothetical protein